MNHEVKILKPHQRAPHADNPWSIHPYVRLIVQQPGAIPREANAIRVTVANGELNVIPMRVTAAPERRPWLHLSPSDAWLHSRHYYYADTLALGLQSTPLQSRWGWMVDPDRFKRYESAYFEILLEGTRSFHPVDLLKGRQAPHMEDGSLGEDNFQ